VLPSFAVGRAQELLVLMYRNGLIEKTFVDGMSRKATRITLRHKGFIDHWDWLNAAANQSTFIEIPSDRQEALRSPSVIITTAGMLNGGPAMDYIRRINQNSEVILTGYQVEGTNGRSLLERGTVRIDGNETKIHTKASYCDLSAHAGRAELYDFVKGCDPTTVLCVHGDHEAASNMAEGLKLEGYDARAPKVGETVKID
jgi:putative mRNA 3-end processing factor